MDNFGGVFGAAAEFIIHPKGNQSITIQNVKVETCVEPVETEYCPDPVTDMQVPYLKLTDSGAGPTATTPWQALIGSGNKYTLADNVTSETMTAVLLCSNEPQIEQLSFNGKNVGNVTLKIYRKNRAQLVEMHSPMKVEVDGETYIYFNELGAEPGNKLELTIDKLDNNDTAFIWNLNLVACYIPVVLCPKELVIDKLNVLTNHTDSGQVLEEYMENPHEDTLNIKLYNSGNPVTLQVNVKEEDEAPAAFYNIKFTVTHAKKVVLTLKFYNGTIVSILKNEIAPHQQQLFENFFGEFGDIIEVEITPRPEANVTSAVLNEIRSVIVYACTQRPKDYCKLRRKTEWVRTGMCESTDLVTFTYCYGSCLPSNYQPKAVFHANVNSTHLADRYEKDCKCCTGTPKQQLTPVPMKCIGEPDKMAYLQEYDQCDCNHCFG